MKRIAIHSVPRSGSTWLGTILDSCPNVIYKYQPLFSYELKSALTLESSKLDVLEFFEKLQVIQDDFMDQEKEKEKGIVPVFEKSNIIAAVYKEVRYHNIIQHLLETDPELKIIGLIRNPMAVINSWLNAPKEFRPDLGWKIEEEWRNASLKNKNLPEEFNGYEKWKEVTFLFEKLHLEYPKRFYLIEYNRLISETQNEVRQLFDFIELPFTKQTIDFIEKSRTTSVNDPYGVFKQKKSDNGWKKSLPAYIVSEIRKDLAGIPLERYIKE